MEGKVQTLVVRRSSAEKLAGRVGSDALSDVSGWSSLLINRKEALVLIAQHRCDAGFDGVDGCFFFREQRWCLSCISGSSDVVAVGRGVRGGGPGAEVRIADRSHWTG